MNEIESYDAALKAVRGELLKSWGNPPLDAAQGSYAEHAATTEVNRIFAAKQNLISALSFEAQHKLLNEVCNEWGVNPVLVAKTWADYADLTTEKWFAQAKPNPNRREFECQLGVHIEEFIEMLDALTFETGHKVSDSLDLEWLKAFAESLKKGQSVVDEFEFGAIKSMDAVEFADSILDQRVTGTGLGVMMGLDMQGAVKCVDISNFSKFENGKVLLQEGGKIAKGKWFFKPNLKPYLTKLRNFFE